MISKNIKIYKGIDIYKIFLAVGIVAIHANVPILATFGRLGVPFFTIVSSFFFFKKYLFLKKKNSKKSYLKKWFKRILYLYIAWEIIYLPSIIRTIVGLLNKGINIRIFFLWLFHYFFPATFINGHTINSNGWGPSWYLLAILFGIPLFAMIINAMRVNDITLGLIALIVEFYFILCSEFYLETHFSNLLIHTAVRLFPYIYLGYIGSKYFMKILDINHMYIYALVAIILFSIENLLCYIYSNRPANEEIITTAPTCFLIFITSLKCKINVKNTIYIREMSTFIYCMQWWPLFIINYLVTARIFPNNCLFEFGSTLLFCIVAYFAFAKLKEKYRFLKYLV